MCKMYLEPSDLSRDPHPCPRAPPRRTVRPFKSPLQEPASAPCCGGGSRGFHSQQELEPQIPSTTPLHHLPSCLDALGAAGAFALCVLPSATTCLAGWHRLRERTRAKLRGGLGAQ